MIPSKVVYKRKPSHGARRACIVACGKYQKGDRLSSELSQPESLARFHLYASGLDSSAIKVQIRKAVIDVRKAFLHAPLKGDPKV